MVDENFYIIFVLLSSSSYPGLLLLLLLLLLQWFFFAFEGLYTKEFKFMKLLFEAISLLCYSGLSPSSSSTQPPLPLSLFLPLPKLPLSSSLLVSLKSRCASNGFGKCYWVVIKANLLDSSSNYKTFSVESFMLIINAVPLLRLYNVKTLHFGIFRYLEIYWKNIFLSSIMP